MKKMKLREMAHILPSITLKRWAGAYPSVTPNNATGLSYKSFTIVIYDRYDSTTNTVKLNYDCRALACADIYIGSVVNYNSKCDVTIWSLLSKNFHSKGRED